MMDMGEKRRFKDIFEKIQGLNCKVTQLRAGDFLISGDKGYALIERKSLGDFIGSVSSKQLWKELEQMHTETTGIEGVTENIRKFVMIEGSFEELIFNRRLHYTVNQVLSGMVTIPLSWNVNLIWLENKRITETFLLSVAGYLGKPVEPPHIYGSRPKRKMKSLDDQQRFFLEGIAGIGGETADKWLKQSGSLRNFFRDFNSNLCQNYPGMGLKRKQHIQDLLDHKYGSEDK